MAQRDNRRILVLFQSSGRSAKYRTLTRGAVCHISRTLDAAIKTSPARTEIEVWLDSPGGDAHASYKLALDLRQRCRKLTVLIPDYAKSAATLLTLGADEIIMAPSAELGPLDVQMPHPDREDQLISGLDIAGSLNYLNEFAIQMILAGGAAMIDATQLPRTEVLDLMQKFVARFLEPCMAKIDPHLTRRAVFQLKVAERYATALLAQRNVGEGFQLKPDEARELVRRLVNEYPVHEFVISREEARRLKLPVVAAEARRDWKAIRKFHDDFLRGQTTIIGVLATGSPSPVILAKPKTVAITLSGAGKPTKQVGSKNGQHANPKKVKAAAPNGKAAKANGTESPRKRENPRVVETG